MRRDVRVARAVAVAAVALFVVVGAVLASSALRSPGDDDSNLTPGAAATATAEPSETAEPTGDRGSHRDRGTDRDRRTNRDG